MVLLVPLSAWASGELTPGQQMNHRMMLLVIQVGVILFVARLGNILFEKVRLPGALGELAAGMIIGPFALGGIHFFGFPHGLFPHFGLTSISPELNGLASIASVVLLFDVGLETDLALLLKYSVVGGLAGAGGVVASFFLGAGTLKLLYPFLYGQEISLFDPKCLMLGVVATATSVGITARILSQRRKLGSPEGVTILSAAVIDDVIGIILLAVVTGLATSTKAGGRIDWGHVGLIGAKAIGIWIAATVVGLAASRRISSLLKWFGERTSIAIMSLGLALFLAGLFEEAGLAMIIGAYVMGLSLSKADIAHLIRERLHPIYELLVPIFFCVIGMRIDFSVLASPKILVLGGVYAVASFVAKVVGSGLPTMLAGFNVRGAARVGFGMAPRCEVALIVAGIGLATGMLNTDLFAAVILMVMINTIVAPPALVLTYKNDKSGLRKEPSQKDKGDKKQRSVSFTFPSMEMAKFLTAKLLSVFENEGYFVHNLHDRRGLYQLRKDKNVMEIYYSGSQITVSCAEEMLPLVQTAVYEAVAALQGVIRGLRKPLLAQDIKDQMPEVNGGNRPRIRIGVYLNPRLIKIPLQGETKKEVIEELLDILWENGCISDLEDARSAVMAREESMSTGLQNGVAIPHGRSDSVSKIVCALGVKPGGVDFDSMDGEPTTIIFLTISPRLKPSPHVQFMSTVGQVLDEEGRERILVCHRSQEVYEILLERGL